MFTRLPPPRSGIEIRGWRIESRKSPIMGSAEYESFAKQHDMPLLPEMVHGDAWVQMTHVASGWHINFNAKDALLEWRRHCYERPSPKVKHAEQWSAQRAEQVESLGIASCNADEDYDWTFLSEYKGSVAVGDDKDAAYEKECKEGIPYDKLRVQEPILFFAEQILFQDELADNGDCILTVKLRVMPSGFFALLRIFMRVDDVMCVIHDTRVYHAFGTKHVLREFQRRGNTYEQLEKLRKLPSDPAKVADANHMWELLEQQELVTHRLPLPE